MDHSIIPQEWKKFLATVQTFFPDAIIAGGALRDLIAEKPVKDVDIFISDLDMNADILNDGLLDKLATALGIKVLSKGDKPDRDYVMIDEDFKALKNEAFDGKVAQAITSSEYVDSDSVRSVYESFINYIVTVKYNSVLYQLIFVEAPTKQYVYNDFDFGLCKIFFDGNKLTITEEFWYDLENKQITFAGKFSVGQAMHTLFVHRENIIKKFPGWKVVIDDLKKRGPEDMPPSFRLMEQRVEQALKDREEKERLKVTISTANVDEDGNGTYFDMNNGTCYDTKTGAMFVMDDNGKKIPVMSLAEKWHTDDPYMAKNLWDQYSNPSNAFIDSDLIYRREKDAEARHRQEQLKVKVDMSHYFNDLEKAKMMGLSLDEMYEIRQQIEANSFE
jgi:hypothetical protein